MARRCVRCCNVTKDRARRAAAAQLLLLAGIATILPFRAGG
jgi:hypothetical protein